MVRKIEIKEKKPVNIYFVGDCHVGSKTFAKKEFEETLKKIKKYKDARVIFMGDHCDLIEEDDTRRYDPHNIDDNYDTAKKQVAYIKKKLKPIKNKIYGILRGNHEATYARYHDMKNYRDFSEKLADDLNTEYLEDMGIIKLKVGKQDYTLISAHGSSGSSRLSTQINQLKRMVANFVLTPDVMAMGHVHSLQTIVDPKMNYNFDVKIKHLALTGSYYRTYTEGNVNYASSRLYHPLPIGCVKYTFDKKGNIKDNKILFDK